MTARKWDRKHEIPDGTLQAKSALRRILEYLREVWERHQKCSLRKITQVLDALGHGLAELADMLKHTDDDAVAQLDLRVHGRWREQRSAKS